ncbi:DNA mismatch repair protein MutT [Saccharothrix sp. ALI-22-I]|uniref:NUDIX domain-containing protein n=1 Tax=Saccharothrix sp. ALI-22-I TaxID=1933778 RepID=UPI00097C5994|nr:NUDIX domain-containing protein [Saccharothrix sp. ALI-22-I]ONI86646.1 DNA mismatch repair protein MutT [Saccharothrix sp. ALI-22-I]
MTGRRSAGILLHRVVDGEPQVLLGHMGGPFWARKDDGAWSIPKGEPDGDEDPETTARREFAEELGLPVPDGDLVPLGEVRQSGGKVVQAWALAGDLDPDQVVPGTFTLEWPRGSGRVREYPEVDRVAWFPLVQARVKVVKAQQELLDRLVEKLFFGQH